MIGKSAWIVGVLAVAALALPAWAHDVKDPVCRMTVDSDTTKFHYKLGNKTFYFCTKECRAKFETAPQKYEKLAAQLEKNDLHDYEVELKTDAAPVAGKPVQLELAIRYADSKKLVPDFEVVHERFLHLVLTSEDLSWFEHQHPVRGEDGIFRLTWTFPRPGPYRLYADFTPADGDNQVKPVPLTVGGGTASTTPLVPDRRLAREVGDLRFRLRVTPAAPLRMEQPALLTYSIEDRHGRPVRDMQPFIGAMGHLLAISQDGKQVVHTHVLQSATDPGMREKEALQVTPGMVSATGPRFTFKLTLPTAGLYKTWAQFQHAGRVYTVPFTFNVQDLWSGAGRTAAAPAGAAPRKATIVVDGAFQPARLDLKPGQPVELTFVRKETSGCGDVLRIPSLRVKRSLKPGERAVIRFTAPPSGTISFTCGMGMYRGELRVR